MEDLSRREFTAAAAATAAVVACAGMGLNASDAKAGEPKGTLSDSWVEVAPLITDFDPSDDLAMYRQHMTLEELNKVRKAAVDACTDYTCEDGTVIPAIWVKVCATADGLGNGSASQSEAKDDTFTAWMRLCNNDEDLADLYINSPVGYRFTALDASVATGRPEEECKEKLNELAFNGMLLHSESCGIDYWQHQRVAHGITESSMNLYMEPGFMDSWNVARPARDPLPWREYYTVPMNAEVVADERVLAYDDVEALLPRHEVFCVSPCQCRYIRDLVQPCEEMPDCLDREAVKDFICADGHHLEKCVTFGEEAKFYIEQGIGRELTRDEAREILRRQAEDEDCVLQSCYTKYTEVICCCDDGCGVLATNRKKGTDNPQYTNLSHYRLMYNKDACLKCGACADRCPMYAIEMDADGYPAVVGACQRCGQCCYICPAEARKLSARPEEEIPELPADLLDWTNRDAMYRYEMGLWPDSDVVVE